MIKIECHSLTQEVCHSFDVRRKCWTSTNKQNKQKLCSPSDHQVNLDSLFSPSSVQAWLWLDDTRKCPEPGTIKACQGPAASEPVLIRNWHMRQPTGRHVPVWYLLDITSEKGCGGECVDHPAWQIIKHYPTIRDRYFTRLHHLSPGGETVA